MIEITSKLLKKILLDITHIMATSRDYEELKYVWEQWHDKSGKLMPDDYVQYVRINNDAAVLNGTVSKRNQKRI